MLNDASGFENIYLDCGYSDLRRGIHGLANFIQQEFKLDSFKTGILFLFCGRKIDRIKGLLWEGDGFLFFIWKLIIIKVLLNRLLVNTFKKYQVNLLEFTYSWIEYFWDSDDLWPITYRKKSQTS